MAKISGIMKLAMVAGPTVVEVVRKFGPTLTKAMKENPEVFRVVQTQVDRMAKARKSGHGSEGLRRRVNILRDQVAYLHASADDARETRRAEEWRRQLDKIDASISVLGAMGKETATREEDHIGKRIDKLSGEILSAFIDEQEEDAQLGRGPAY